MMIESMTVVLRVPLQLARALRRTGQCNPIERRLVRIEAIPLRVGAVSATSAARGPRSLFTEYVMKLGERFVV